jgi:hypothetical protein
VFRMNQLNRQPNLAQSGYQHLLFSYLSPVWAEYIAGLVTGKMCNSVTAYANSLSHHGWWAWQTLTCSY